MAEVICIDPCLNVSPYHKGIDESKFPKVVVGEPYKVKEEVDRFGKKYYRFIGFPYNHIFDVRGFVQNVPELAK